MRCARVGIALCVVIMTFGQSPESVSQEDLVAHYERYNGSRVVVSGEVVSGEGTVMYLPSGPTDSGTPAGMVISFTEALSKKPGVLEKRFIKEIGRASCRERRRVNTRAGRSERGSTGRTAALDLTLGSCKYDPSCGSGRFEGSPDRRWGHQACCRFRLQVERVISLK